MSGSDSNHPQQAAGAAPAAQPARPGLRWLEDQVASRVADVVAWTLKLGGTRAYRYLLRALKERQPVTVDADIQLVAPDLVAPEAALRPLVERIFAAYVRAKRDQVRGDSVLWPQGGWKNVIDQSYAYLIDGWRDDDLDRFHYFLTNFGAWHDPTGITESHKLHAFRSSRQQRLHFEQRVMGSWLAWWKLFESQGRDFSALTMPRFGNQCGALVDGHFVSTDSVASDIDARLLAGVVVGQRPVIGELGGGFGRLTCFLARQIPEFTYVGLDLPECLACASFYLMQAFPRRRFLLYGEASVSPQTWSEYDFVLLPSSEITSLADLSIDLFLNENSLGLMTPQACSLFVREICRIAKTFWHRNHEARRNRFADGVTSLINSEYPVDRVVFPEIVRYCDIRRFVGPEGWTLENDMFWYYFHRGREA